MKIYEKLKSNKKLVFYLCLGIWFIVEVLILLLLNKNLYWYIDSDMSAEMILSKILNEEHAFITNNWFYSSEIRVLYSQLLYSFFFHFTDNWHTVRMLSIIVMHMMLSFSTMYMCSEAGHKEYGPLAASGMILAFNFKYFYIVVCACAYVFFITVSILTIGNMMAFGKNISKKKRIGLIISSCVLAFLAGLNGIRQIVITYTPLLMASALMSVYIIYDCGINEYKKSSYFKYFLFSIITFIFNGLGYLVNSQVLAKSYHFQTWDGVRFVDFKIYDLSIIFSDILQNLGFEKGYISFPILFGNAVSAILFLMLIYALIRGFDKKASSEYHLFTTYFLCNLLIFVTIYTFTDMLYNRWYNIPIIIYTFPLITLCINDSSIGKFPTFTKPLLGIIVALLVVCRSSIFYFNLAHTNKNKSLMRIAEYLETTDYNSGFATYWNSNIMTELSNGKLEMRTWRDSGKDGSLFINQESPDKQFKWLEPRKHVENDPKGKVFVIYNENEIPYCNWKDQLYEKDIIFSTESYVVYGYDSFETMLETYK